MCTNTPEYSLSSHERTLRSAALFSGLSSCMEGVNIPLVSTRPFFGVHKCTHTPKFSTHERLPHPSSRDGISAGTGAGQPKTPRRTPVSITTSGPTREDMHNATADCSSSARSTPTSDPVSHISAPQSPCFCWRHLGKRATLLPVQICFDGKVRRVGPSLGEDTTLLSHFCARHLVILM
jgi:hypothetical protein